jgi:SPP1 gp7 family putative phage head morphogenesis protein
MEVYRPTGLTFKVSDIYNITLTDEEATQLEQILASGQAKPKIRPQRLPTYEPPLVFSPEEIQFDELELSESLKKLRELISKGLAAKLKLATENIGKLKRTPLSINYLGDLIIREIKALTPTIHQIAVVSTYHSYIEGYTQPFKEVAKLGGIIPTPTIPTTIEVGTLLKALQGTLERSSTPADNLITLPILNDAVSRLQAAKAIPANNYLETAARVREGAFSVTTTMEENGVNTIKQLVIEGIEEGYGVDEFIEKVQAKFDHLPLTEHHIENVFRTNVATALSDGKYDAIRQPIVSDYFPYVQRFATRDTRVRPEHLAFEKLGLNNTNIYRVDDPTWIKYRVPIYYQCRCVDTYTTVEQAARKGVQEAKEWVERATIMSSKQGGSFYQYLNVTKPKQVQWVDAKPFEGIPHFDRTPV